MKSGTAVAFNGGKESAVVSHMFLSGAHFFFCVASEYDFTEIVEYIKAMEKIWNINVLFYSDYKSAIVDLKEKGCTTVVLGNRRTDPGSENLECITQTDRGWPQIDRLFPILEWKYGQVWNYIEENKIPVCELYSKGFTSIGNLRNTFPNYTLFDGCSFFHAKNLKDEKLERVGRTKCLFPLEFSGIVVKGNGNGKKIGFPTANLDIGYTPNIEDGVYYGYAMYKNLFLPMVMSVGPILSADIFPGIKKTKTYEAYIIQQTEDPFLKDFYGERLFVRVNGFIRPMLKFESLEELKNMIKKDVAISFCQQNNLSRAVSTQNKR